MIRSANAFDPKAKTQRQSLRAQDRTIDFALGPIYTEGSGKVRIPGQGEKDSGRNVKTIPG